MEESPIQPAQNKKSKTAPIVVGLLVVIAGGYYALSRYLKKQDTTTTPIPTVTNDTSTSPVTDTNNQTAPAATNLYKDGVYSTLGDYVSPGGAEQIDVKVTLKGDVITDAQVISKASRPNSIKFQGQFISGFSSLVVGKKIDDVKLDKISGSSLTPNGWNDAIEKIKAEAKV